MPSAAAASDFHVLITWLPLSAVAVCLADVILDKLTVTYMYWLTDYLSSSWVSDWSNSGLTDSDLHVLIDWLPRAIAECLTDVILD